MRRLLGILDAFWFAAGSATRLAALRVVIGGCALYFLLDRFRLYAAIATTSPELFEPVGPIVLLGAPLAPSAFEAVMTATLLAGVAFVLGWQFSWTGPLFAVLLVLVVSYRNSWSMIYHVDNVLVLHVVVLGLTRSADAWSLDALGGRTIGAAWGAAWREFVLQAHGVVAAGSESGGRRRHWEYGYPVRLLCAVTVAVYVLSAVAKLAGPVGLSWVLGESLRNQIGFDALRKELLEGGAGLLAYAVFNNVALATFVGVATIVLELGSVAALLDARVGRAWAVAAYGMHWGIHVVMGISFWYQLIGIAFAPFLIGEGTVGWCRAEALRWIRALTRLPAARHASIVPYRERRRPGPRYGGPGSR